MPFTFEVSNGDRLAIWEHDARIITPTRHAPRSLDEGEGGVEIFAVDQVISTRTGEPAKVPDDLVAWIERHPDLDIISSRPASVGGLEGVLIDLASVRGAELVPQIELTWDRRIGLNAGARTEMYVLDAGSTWVVIFPVRPIDRHQRHIADADSAFAPGDRAFLETLDFSPSTR